MAKIKIKQIGSPIRRPEDLAGHDVAVGYHSGSHFSALQSLEAFLRPDDILMKYIHEQDVEPQNDDFKVTE